MDQQEDFSKLSLQDRWTHAKWNARQSAYKEAIELFENGQVPVGLDEMRRCSSDANVVALESGINVVFAFLKTSNEQTNQNLILDVQRACIKQISEKGLGALKPAVKQAALNTVLMAVEVGNPSLVVNDLLDLVKVAKSPKLIVAYLNALNQVLSLFGSPVADLSLVLKSLQTYFGNSDPKVRQSAVDLSITCCRWTNKQTMLAVLKGLKPVQINELVPKFDAIDYNSQPQRLTRSQMATPEDLGNGDMSVEGDIDLNTQQQQQQQEIDPWSLEEPVDVLSKIPESFFNEIESKKWKERSDALAPLADKLSGASKITKNVDMLNRLAPKLIHIASKDMNIACSTSAIKALSALASGLRTDFSDYVQQTLDSSVERFKDKKQQTIEIIRQCIDNVYLYVLGGKIGPVLDSVLDAGMSHRTPTIKLESSNYLSHLLCMTPHPLKLPELQRILPVAVKTLGETSEPLRDAAARILAALTKIASPERLEPSLKALDEHKRKRINGWVDKLEVKSKMEAPVQRQVPQQRQPQQQTRAPQQRPPQAAPPGQRPRVPPPTNLGVRPGQRATATSAAPGVRPVASRAPLASGRPLASTRPSVRPPTSPTRIPPRPGPPPQRDLDPLDSDSDLSELASPQQQIERPSFSSTPRMVKRTHYSAGITPARGYDNYRRRMESPLKSNQSPAPNVVSDAQIIEELQERVSQLTVELSSERNLRLEIERKLAEAQVVKEKTISSLKNEVAALKLNLQIQRQETEQWLANANSSNGRWSDSIGEQLSSLNIGSQSAHQPPQPHTQHHNHPVININTKVSPNSNRRSFSGGVPINSRPINPDSSIDRPVRHPIRPISMIATRSDDSINSHHTADDEEGERFDRAINLTESLKQRVASLKKSRMG